MGLFIFLYLFLSGGMHLTPSLVDKTVFPTIQVRKVRTAAGVVCVCVLNFANIPCLKLMRALIKRGALIVHAEKTSLAWSYWPLVGSQHRPVPDIDLCHLRISK